MTTDTPIIGNTPITDAASVDAPEPSTDFASNADLNVGSHAVRRDYGTDGDQPAMFGDEGEDEDALPPTTASGDDVPEDDDEGADEDAEIEDDDDDDLVTQPTDYDPVENRPRGDEYAPVE